MDWYAQLFEDTLEASDDNSSTSMSTCCNASCTLGVSVGSIHATSAFVFRIARCVRSSCARFSMKYLVESC